jgi:hypothetical protein
MRYLSAFTLFVVLLHTAMPVFAQYPATEESIEKEKEKEKKHQELTLPMLGLREAEDAFETWQPGPPGVEVARLLARAGTVGVWGNHDIGLSINTRARLAFGPESMI